MKLSTQRLSVTLLVTALGAIASSTVPAAAAGSPSSAISSPAVSENSRTVTQTRIVKFGDLNLGKHEGAVALYRRLGHAARMVCGGSPDAHGRFAYQYFRCRNEALRNAVRDINAPLLTAYYESRNGAGEEAARRVASTD